MLLADAIDEFIAAPLLVVVAVPVEVEAEAEAADMVAVCSPPCCIANAVNLSNNEILSVSSFSSNPIRKCVRYISVI